MGSEKIRLLKRLCFLLLPYSLIRIGFFFYHHNIYQQFSSSEIVESLFLGIRFDSAALCLINLPVIFLSLVPSTNSKFLLFDRIVFIVINFLAIVAGLDDYELFLFMGKRLSFDFFLMTEDILAQLPQVFLYYWYLPITAVLFCIGFYFFDKKYFSYQLKNVPLWKNILASVLILGATFIGIRGGLQHKSINVQSAFTQGKNELGHLVLNTPYHFIRTLSTKPPKKVKYFKTEDEVRNLISEYRKSEDGIKGRKNTNVVLILLESFSEEYVEQGYAPFLKELQTKGLNFPKHLANGRRSIEVLPSVLCALPSLLDEPVSKSIYQGNNYPCFPKILKDVGYTNHFFHAGARGTMGFEAYTLAHGFDRYFSKEDYPNKNDDDGTWGIYDEPYLQYVAGKIGEMRQPFMAGIFTLSSHQPYSIPDSLKDKFPKGTAEIHASIGYTDYSLRKFFEKARKESWFQNTLFIITSDHSQKLTTEKYQNMVGRYRVPMIWFQEGVTLSEVKKVTQHSDIPKSVLDYVEVVGELAKTGGSVFVQDDGAAINYADGRSYVLVSNTGVLAIDKNSQQVHYDYNWETGELSHKKSSDEKKLKAFLQYFFNGLIKNNLSL